MTTNSCVQTTVVEFELIPSWGRVYTTVQEFGAEGNGSAKVGPWNCAWLVVGTSLKAIEEGYALWMFDECWTRGWSAFWYFNANCSLICLLWISNIRICSSYTCWSLFARCSSYAFLFFQPQSYNSLVFLSHELKFSIYFLQVDGCFVCFVC